MKLLHPLHTQNKFMELYEPLHARLARFIQTLVWNTEDAKDVHSETILIAYEKFNTLKNEDTFLYFLFGIASNLVKQKLRRQKFAALFSLNAAEHLQAQNSSEETLLRRELYEALQKLSSTHREALILFEISGFSIKEIAQQMKMSESAIKNYLKRGREKLNKLLTENSTPIILSPLTERSAHGKQY
jgi:RNA polymerase sigma-70 factor, ECF subfamily